MVEGEKDKHRHEEMGMEGTRKSLTTITMRRRKQRLEEASTQKKISR